MKHLRMLGLGLMAALSLMAFVGATQASAEWNESGSIIASNLEGNAKIVGLETEQAVVHGVLSVPAKELEILCKKVTAGKDSLLIAKSSEVKGTLEFTECANFQKKVESKGCKPAEPITTTKIVGRLILHEGRNYVLIEPEAGPSTKFATIDYNEETCALPDADVTGSTVAECLGEKYELSATTKVDYCATELVNHLITEAPRTLFTKDILKYGANEAFIKGVVSVGLNTGNKWSGKI
jgi:hypothetical protein